MVQQLLDKGELHRLSCVVVDEVHMVGDGGTRGQHLELLLSLLLYLRKTTGTMALRLICMSATISNLDEIEQWLHAKKFYTEYVVGWLVGWLVYVLVGWWHSLDCCVACSG